MDYDEIDLSNLHRQLLHTEENVGGSKVGSIKEFIAKLNTNIKVITHPVLLNASNAIEILSQYEIVSDASDNVATRYLLNDACVLLKKPLVSGSALQLEGQMTVYNYQNGPCYRCIFPQPPPPETVQNCGDAGVLGAVTSVIGSLQAMEVIKIILEQDSKKVSSGKLLLYDAAMCSFRTIKLRGRRENCCVCGNNPTVKELIDYEEFCGMKATDKNPNLKVLNADERISVEEYKNFCHDHMLIDVRSATEFEMCRLQNAINIPIKTILSGKIDKHLTNEMHRKTVFVICRRGNDSQIAVRHLSDNHNVKARDIIGGLHEYRNIIDNDFPFY